ncbi:hypothetical protein [Acinetobacter baumannii]|nr:hypothetical protein H0H24_01930 [Acinetobacter baumannii]
MKVLVHDGLGIWLCPAAGTGQISLGSSSPVKPWPSARNSYRH